MAITSEELEQQQEWLREALGWVDTARGGMFPSQLSEISSDRERRFQAIYAPENVSVSLPIPGLHPRYFPSYDFAINTHNNFSIFTSHHALTTEGYDRDITNLGNILEGLTHSRELANKNVRAIQFPIAINVNLGGTRIRAHFLQLVIVKQPDNTLNAVLIDSTNNPVGVGNSPTQQVVGWGTWLLSQVTSSVTVVDSLKNRLREVFRNPLLQAQLGGVFGADVNPEITFLHTIYTGVQGSLDGDKRCGVFVLQGELSLMQYLLSNPPHAVSHERLKEVLTQAHDLLNAPELSDAVPTSTTRARI